MSGGILLIDLWPIECECVVCEATCGTQFGLALYEDVLIADDDEESEWAGFPCCALCYLAWTLGAFVAGMTTGEARELVEGFRAW